jgi:hypothetical protein
MEFEGPKIIIVAPGEYRSGEGETFFDPTFEEDAQVWRTECERLRRVNFSMMRDLALTRWLFVVSALLGLWGWLR